MIRSEGHFLTTDQRVIWPCPFELIHGWPRENARRFGIRETSEDGERDRGQDAIAFSFFIFSGAATYAKTQQQLRAIQWRPSYLASFSNVS